MYYCEVNTPVDKHLLDSTIARRVHRFARWLVAFVCRRRDASSALAEDRRSHIRNRAADARVQQQQDWSGHDRCR